MQEDYWYDLKATLIRNTEISAATDEGEKRGRVKEKVKIEKNDRFRWHNRKNKYNNRFDKRRNRKNKKNKNDITLDTKT